MFYFFSLKDRPGAHASVGVYRGLPGVRRACACAVHVLRCAEVWTMMMTKKRFEPLTPTDRLYTPEPPSAPRTAPTPGASAFAFSSAVSARDAPGAWVRLPVSRRSLQSSDTARSLGLPPSRPPGDLRQAPITKLWSSIASPDTPPTPRLRSTRSRGRDLTAPLRGGLGTPRRGRGEADPMEGAGVQGMRWRLEPQAERRPPSAEGLPPGPGAGGVARATSTEGRPGPGPVRAPPPPPPSPRGGAGTAGVHRGHGHRGV